MKKLKPIIITRYLFQCDFCGKTYGEKKAIKHEEICYKNPNRHCKNCSDTGIRTVGYHDAPVGEICSSCIIATKCGGKSYIEITSSRK